MGIVRVWMILIGQCCNLRINTKGAKFPENLIIGKTAKCSKGGL